MGEAGATYVGLTVEKAHAMHAGTAFWRQVQRAVGLDLGVTSDVSGTRIGGIHTLVV